MKTEGNTVFITGGATGIGFALAEQFSLAGNEVIICGRRENRLREAREKLPAIHIRVSDVSKEDDRLHLMNWLTENFGSFNILINNAGIQRLIFLGRENNTEKFKEEAGINLIAPVHLSNLAVSHLRKQKESAIINITSGLGFVPLAIMPLYCSTKAGLHIFTVCLRHQLKNSSIKVFEIIPPIVETELGMDGTRKEKKVHGIHPSEVAKETLNALKSDHFEFAIGDAVNLYNAAHSDKLNLVFERMNG